MVLSGELTFNAVAMKAIDVEKTAGKNGLIIERGKNATDDEKITDFVDHPFQGEVVGIGPNVTTCSPGDIILIKISSQFKPLPYLLNDKGTILFVYNEGDIVLVRKKQ